MRYGDWALLTQALTVVYLMVDVTLDLTVAIVGRLILRESGRKLDDPFN
jgi:hypothetical protein